MVIYAIVVNVFKEPLQGPLELYSERFKEKTNLNLIF